MLEEKKNEFKKSIKEIFKSPKEVISFFLPIIVAIIFIIPLPYYIRMGGGIIPLENRIQIKGEGKNGYYGALYVRESKAVVLTYLASYVFPSFEKEKIENVTVDNEDETSYNYREKLYFTSSLEAAKKVAYEKAGKKVKVSSSKYTIIYIDKDNKTELKVGDEILSINNKKVNNYDSILDNISNSSKNGSINIEVLRDNKKINTVNKYIDIEGEKKLGIVVSNQLEYKVNPPIKFKFKGSEAGPSGGLMMSLVIYDKLMPKDITGGKKIVGTGTIDIEGNVGRIGGIKEKLGAANKKKADVVFVPKDNYKEAKKLYDKNGYKFKLISVEKFDDAVSFLEK